jgi:hypothetical protein
MRACGLRGGNTHRGSMRACALRGGSRHRAFTRACALRCLGAGSGNGRLEGGSSLRFHSFRLHRHRDSRRRCGCVVLTGGDRSRGDTQCVGRRRIDAVGSIGTRDQDRRDGRQKELAGPEQSPPRSQRGGDEQRLRHVCRARYVIWCGRRRRRVSGWPHRRCVGCTEKGWIRRAAVVAVCRGLIVDRIALLARLQLQRRGTVVAEPGTRWVAMVADGAHPVAKIRGARGERPVRGASRAHAGILSCGKDQMAPHARESMARFASMACQANRGRQLPGIDPASRITAPHACVARAFPASPA